MAQPLAVETHDLEALVQDAERFRFLLRQEIGVRGHRDPRWGIRVDWLSIQRSGPMDEIIKTAIDAARAAQQNRDG